VRVARHVSTAQTQPLPDIAVPPASPFPGIARLLRSANMWRRQAEPVPDHVE